MPIDTAEYRRILGHWVTGVSVVAAKGADGKPCGLTANAVTSLSLDPPLVLVCIERSADSHVCIRTSGAFTINVLRANAERIARRFATSEGNDKFGGVGYRDAASGAPILEDALAWVDCIVRETHPGGDHTIFIGEILEGDAVEGDPLVFYRGGYGRFQP